MSFAALPFFSQHSKIKRQIRILDLFSLRWGASAVVPFLPPAQMPPRRLPVAFCRPAQMPPGRFAGRDNCRPADFKTICCIKNVFKRLHMFIIFFYLSFRPCPKYFSIQAMSKIFFYSGHVQNIFLFRPCPKYFSIQCQ